jgi:hypothetical protein
MSEKSVPIDIKLRGAALNLSVSFEAILMSVVYSCSGEIYSDPQYSHLLKLKGCMFAQKIGRVKDALEIFHPDLLESNAQLFVDLNNFRDFRNRMAHCAFSFGDNILEFEVWDVVEDENRFQHYHPIRYTIDDFLQTMDTSIRQIHPPLSKLWRDVESRLQRTHPEVFAVLQSGKRPPAESDQF